MGLHGMYKEIIAAIQKETGTHIKISKENPIVLEAMILEEILNSGCKQIKSDITFYTNKLKALFKESEEIQKTKFEEIYNKAVKDIAQKIRSSGNEEYEKATSRFLSEIKEYLAAADRKQAGYVERMQKIMEKCLLSALAFFLGCVLLAVIVVIKA